MRNLSPLRLAVFSLVAWLAACGDDGDGVTDPPPAAGAGQGGQTAGSGGKTAGSGGTAGASQGGAGAGGAGAGGAGKGGAGGAGKGGTAGNAGSAGNAGTAGKGGAGGAGNGGSAGSGATAGSSGKGGSAGNGGAAGSAGSGGDPCPAGQVDCPCGPGDVCDSGSCVGGVCVACPTGELGCDCFSDGSCGKDLRCESSLCVACIAGLQGCPCGEGDTCGTGLKCQGDLCVPSDCTDGVQGCPCLPDKTCEGELVCGDSLCRAAIDCASLVSAGSCDPNQTCTEAAAGSDAVCVPETCNAGFLWNPLTSKCVACVTPDCSAEPSCDASAPGSIATKCADQQRECVQAGAVAFCGPCVAGTSENGGQCVALPSCGGVTCALNEYCDKQASTPTCTPLPCPAGQSKDTSGACISCSSSCEGEGLTGRPWPFTSLSDECICETKDNYFLLSGGASVATACDADGDGWVRKESEESTDPQLIQNNRCKLRTIDRVILVDQYGVSMEVGSCAQGLIKLPDNTSCPTRVPLRLLETLLLDEPGLIVQDPSTPPYANGGKTKDDGRPLQARELNTLTKACVSLNGDFNNNQIADIAEVQPLAPGEDDQLRLSAFAYFVELYSAFYEPPSSGEGPGRMVLRERSRCGDDFPLRYDTSVTDPTVLPPADAWADDGSNSTYWRNCYVGRDPAYDSKSAAPGFDFAQWSCDPTSGSCSLPPPAHADLVNVDPKQTLMRDHGLCELQGKLPKDNLWRGMSHHSQFKCVNVTSQPPSKPYDRSLADFSDPAPNLFVLDSCVARACAETPCAGSREISPGSNAFEPVIDCTALPAASAGVVGFAAVRYQGYGANYTTTTYQGGCVNEDAAWGSLLCPSPQFNTKSQDDKLYGRYSCHGDPQNYLWCSQPCTPQISTLHWAAKGGSSVNGSLWR